MMKPQLEGSEMLPLMSHLLRDEPDLYEVVADFVRELPVRIKSIREAFHDGETDMVLSQIHNLKSTGGSYGYLDLTGVAAKIEYQLKNDDRSQIPGLIDQLGCLVKRIQLGLHGNTPDRKSA